MVELKKTIGPIVAEPGPRTLTEPPSSRGPSPEFREASPSLGSSEPAKTKARQTADDLAEWLYETTKKDGFPVVLSVEDREVVAGLVLRGMKK